MLKISWESISMFTWKYHIILIMKWVQALCMKAEGSFSQNRQLDVVSAKHKSCGKSYCVFLSCLLFYFEQTLQKKLNSEDLGLTEVSILTFVMIMGKDFPPPFFFGYTPSLLQHTACHFACAFLQKKKQFFSCCLSLSCHVLFILGIVYTSTNSNK